MRNFIRFTTFLVIIVILLTGCSITANNKDTYLYNRDKTDIGFIEANSGFTFDIFREINKEDKDKSVFISPLSISTALSMTYQGARGTTKDSMTKALGYTGLSLETINDSYKNLLSYLKGADKKVQLNISNSIWLRKGEIIKEEFIAINQNVFDALIEELDFSLDSAPSEINKWVDGATKGKIKEIVNGPIPNDTLMYLINAIYFKGDWTDKFDKNKTFKAEFRQGNGEKQQIDMMSRNGKIEYGEGTDYQVVRLPYGNENIAMYCILPDETIEINDFINSISLDKWSDIKGAIVKRNDVLIQIPRFKLEYGIKELNDSLHRLGMAEAFSDYADFTGISENIAISKVSHMAVIEVNEEGSEAAAVTVVEVTATAAMDPISFIADRPFLFIIEDKESETILFIGKLYNIQ